MILQLRRRAGCLLAAFVLVLAACGEPSPEALLASAKEAMARHDSKSAVVPLKALLQQAPDSPEARFLLGSAFLDAGDAVAAGVELRKALELQHPKDAVIPVLARALILENQFAKLTTEFADLQLTQPAALADFNTSMAIAHARQGRGEQARTALESALSADPNHGRARALQARFKAETGDVDGALAMLDEELRRQPDNVDAWQLKGDLLFLFKQDAAAALEAHRQALQARPDLATSHASILSILLAQKDIAGARRQLAELKKHAPNQPHTVFAEAEIAFLEKDFKTAKELTQQLLRYAPDNVRLLQLAGAIELQSGSALQATTFLSKALRGAPHPATQRLLVQAYLRAGEPDQALRLLAPLLQAPKPDAEALALAAQAHLVKGDAKTAESFFARAAEANPADMGSRTALALAQVSKGDTERGYAQLEAIAADDKGTGADLALVGTNMRQGRFDEALKAIDGYEAKQPNTAMAAHLRGMIQLARKDVPVARQHFERALTIDPVYLPAVLGLVAMDLAEKKPEQAGKRFEAVLAVDKNNVRALMGLASLRASAGAGKDEVTGLLTRAVRADPSGVEPRLRLIEAQIKGGDPAAALAAAQEGVAAQPDSPQLLQVLGHVQAASGDIGQAIATFNRLAELQPRSAETQLRLGDLHLANRNRDAARQSYQRALALVPDLLPAQRGLIMIEAAAGRTQQALAMARAVQAVPARAAVGWMYTGDIEAARKNWAPAIAAYRSSLRLADTVEATIKLHQAMLAAKQPVEADRLIADWTGRHPGNPAMLAYTGNLALSRQDFAAAEGIYASIVQMQPDNAVAQNNMAVILSRLNKPGALAYAEKANALQPGQPMFMDTMAMLLADAGQVDKAIELEQRALALQSGNSSIRLNLARLYIKAGQKSQARRELEQLASLGDGGLFRDEVARLLKEL